MIHKINVFLYSQTIGGAKTGIIQIPKRRIQYGPGRWLYGEYTSLEVTILSEDNDDRSIAYDFGNIIAIQASNRDVEINTINQNIKADLSKYVEYVGSFQEQAYLPSFVAPVNIRDQVDPHNINTTFIANVEQPMRQAMPGSSWEFYVILNKLIHTPEERIPLPDTITPVASSNSKRIRRKRKWL